MSTVRFVSKSLRACILQNAKNTPVRSLSSSSAAIREDLVECDKLSWKLCASTCLIRMPLLEQRKNKIEQSFEDFMSQLEFEKSVLCDWELEKIRQAALIREVEAGKVEASTLDFKFSNQEVEDGCDISLTQFKNSFAETNPDDADLRNPNRRARETLVLITKQKLGKDHVWMLPLKGWSEGETLQETAENALTGVLGNDLPAQFISNAPSSFYKYKIPKLARPGTSFVGVKLFIYSAFIPRSSYARSTVDVNSFSNILQDEDVVDYAWVAADEMRQYMKPKYVDMLRGILL